MIADLDLFLLSRLHLPASRMIRHRTGIGKDSRPDGLSARVDDGDLSTGRQREQSTQEVEVVHDDGWDVGDE
jgi:hypothetical protein